ncbi:MAG TPA: hypothetical protein VMF07_07260 [Solirubrobacteraceae bacterium]|nr:hypothetical protein [Solirubrobacteraceae bacterium]
MSTDTRRDEAQPPTAQFEDRLLATILDEFDAFTATAPRVRRARRRSRRALTVWATVPALATAAAAAVAVAVATPRRQSHHVAREVPVHVAAASHPRHRALYKLADASVSAPAMQGRYVVLAETDSETDEPGQSRRTTVIDSRTGSSVTYQQPYADSHAPSELTEGAERTDTEAWFVALPTDPGALRARLLHMAEVQQQKADAIMRRKLKLEARNAGASKAFPKVAGPRPSDADLVYEEANDMLWNPLSPPALRSALYKVLAGTSGFTVEAGATDPSGRPAVAMTRSTNVDGTAETDITYEDPSTGVVLAQVWKTGSDTITAVYQPVTSTDTMPSNPY